MLFHRVDKYKKSENRGKYWIFISHFNIVYLCVFIKTVLKTLPCANDKGKLMHYFSVFSNNIPADFEFKLEVYSHILQDDLTMASTPRKIKKTIHSSISRTVGKKLAASLRDELNSGKM